MPHLLRERCHGRRRPHPEYAHCITSGRTYENSTTWKARACHWHRATTNFHIFASVILSCHFPDHTYLDKWHLISFLSRSTLCGQPYIRCWVHTDRVNNYSSCKGGPVHLQRRLGMRKGRISREESHRYLPHPNR